ncbi:AbiV family abortive infection protein [Paraflavitalea pollutisoli]|uniref:AbiV family abortive infection protein n=1 Tax=Paraflavitalea pollutisoli TaxID=3034143 RepID=UPI0023EABA0C|nr:AbiV family abortive infection protein [Paraflavitalea sp. H1-2-19X]
MKKMTEKEKIEQYMRFRTNCLKNAEEAFQSAIHLAGKGVNHIAYHLLVLALEEIGKVFVGYTIITRTEKWGKPSVNFGFDDHVKKLFWAIWGPSFGSKTITRQDWESNKQMARQLHENRLATLYTAIDDSLPGKEKIAADEIKALISYTEDRLELAKLEGEKKEEDVVNPEVDWLSIQLDDPDRRHFILGETSQHQLEEFDGDFSKWIHWLQEYYQNEKDHLTLLAEAELKRIAQTDLNQITAKWKMRIKIITPSHDIRQSTLEQFNKRNPHLKLYAGADTHFLLIEFTFGDNVPAKDLWHYGWHISKLFVAAINISAGGFFYWNAITDKTTYYEGLHDLQTNSRIKVSPPPTLNINWEKASIRLTESHLDTTEFMFTYLLQNQDQVISQAISLYGSALALIAKSDVHSHFEALILRDLSTAFRTCAIHSLPMNSSDNFVDVAYNHLDGMIKDKQEFARVITMAAKLEDDASYQAYPIKLTDILLLKQYCGFLLLTIAARKLNQDNNIKLSIDPI